MKALIVFLFLFVSIGAAENTQFDKDIELLARDMAETLELSPEKPFSITTIVEDKTYMLSLAPVFTALREKLQPFVSNVKFNAFRGSENATIRLMIINGTDEYAPVEIKEKQIDSLVLSGAYFLIDGDSQNVNFSVSVMNLQPSIIFESNEIKVSVKDCPPSLKREVFAKLRDKKAFSMVNYRGEIIKKLDILFNSPGNNYLALPAEYKFVNNHPYGIQWQIQILQEILALKYAIDFNDAAENSITVEPTGSLMFNRNGQKRPVSNAVAGESLFKEDFPEEKGQYHYISANNNNKSQPAQVFTKSYKTESEVLIRDKIYKTFNEIYPALFDPFDRKKLDEIFESKDHPSILSGRIVGIDPARGKESIQYVWLTKQQWLDRLEKWSNDGRKFALKTNVMGVFNDNIDGSRYWAIVKQKWQTQDQMGNTVYQDDGFLFVNFDFDSASGKLRNFKIHYRIWFYDYQYDDPELNVKRYQKLENDINNHFVNGLGGIDKQLKKSMRDFLISKISKDPFKIEKKAIGK